MKNIVQMYEKDAIEILTAESSHSFPLHSHESFCLGMVNLGKVRFKIGEQEKVLGKGMSFLIPSNVGVIITPVDERYGYTTICLKRGMKDEFMKYEYQNYFPKLNQKVVCNLCEEYKKGISSEKFVEQLTCFLKDYMLEKPEIRNDESIEAGKQYILSHIQERFNLDVLAEYVHMSKFHLIRRFKKETGVTPNQYYIQAKVFAAKQELKQKRKETDVAMDLNFSDQSYLCNIFRRQMGISMREFKENFVSNK